MTIDIRGVIGLPPEDTARAFDTRDELRLTTRWSEMWQHEHARAFTVAKVANLDLLETIRTSLADVVHNGGTFEQWQKDLVPMLQRAGWWGRVQDRGLTGTGDPVHVGPRRLRTIYHTNMRVSRAAGQWTRIQAAKADRPYLRYVAVMDRRTRLLHRQWHGTILPVDHEWWSTHFPPCGWNCRCTVVQLSERDIERRGWKVSEAPPPEGPPSTWWRAGSDQPEVVPAGIDPGWAYNPGAASMRAVADKAAATLERTAAVDLAGARAALREMVDSPAFLEALDEPGTAFPVMVLDDATRAVIGSEARVAMLSAETYAKQRREHPELPIARYRQLPAVAEAPDIVARDRERDLLLTKADDGRWLVAVLRRTQTRKGLFLVSFRVQNEKSLPRLLRGAEIVSDKRK